MTYKKDYKITGKIFYKKDLITLFQNTLDILSSSMKNEIITQEIIIKFNDGITLTNNNISIFDNIYVEKKKIKSIEINIGDKYFNNSISIDLGYINKISIRTKTKTLFESLQHCIEENLNFTKKQNCFYKVQESILLEFLIIVVLMLFEIGLLLYLKFVCNIVLMEITNGLICIVLPVLIFNQILRYIESNYPPVDFNFGDNSVNKPKEPHKLWSKIIGYIFGSIIIPILLSIFF